MTTNEMRQRLAEAMGWTEIIDAREAIPWDGDWLGYAPGSQRYVPIPNPLESDRDAALLRAWCVGKGWAVETQHTSGPSMASIIWPPGNDEHFCIVADTEEPDPCRRERLALCRAVLQAIEAGGAP